MRAQVKIAGHRVEIGEVESALRSTRLSPPLLNFQIQDVAVVPTSSMSGSKASLDSGSGFLTLTAFIALVVNESAENVTGDENSYAKALRATLEMDLTLRLPAYMIPRKWVFYLYIEVDDSNENKAGKYGFRVGALPLNANGKVNRKALIASVDQKTNANEILCSTPAVLSSGGTPGSFEDLLKVVKMAVNSVLGSEDTGFEGDETILDDFNLQAAGIASIGVVVFCSHLSALLGGLDIPATILMAHPRVVDFARYLHEDRRVQAPNVESKSTKFILGKTTNEDQNQDRNKHSMKSAPMFDPGMEACREGRLVDVYAFLESGWDVETVDRFGSPGLHWAASGGFLEVCKALVEVGGADPLKRDKKSGRSAIHWAARQGHLHVVTWLIQVHGLLADDLTKVMYISLSSDTYFCGSLQTF